MATQQEVNEWINVNRQELWYYGNRLATRTQHGHMPTVQKQIKLMLLEAFTFIAETYLEEWEDTENNMFDLTSFDEIQRHINRICNSFHWVDLR